LLLRGLALLIAIVPSLGFAQRVVTATGDLATTSPFQVSATATSPENITYAYVYLNGVRYAHAPGKTITATITAPPGRHRLSFTFKQASGENLQSTMYVNVSGSSPPVSRTVTLDWNASATPEVAGYRVYRGDAAGGPYGQITSSTVPQLTYDDTNVTSGRTYFYVVTAVGTNGAESEYSNESQVVIP
jgi:hypothetical protein